jgi:hypothetical protein
VITKGDIWLGEEPTLPKYLLTSSTDWWMDDKNWFGRNGTDAYTLTTATWTLLNPSLTEIRNPGKLSDGLTVPDWASRVIVDIKVEFGASATGVRQIRVRSGAVGIPELRATCAASADGTTIVQVHGEAGVTAGSTLNIDAYQTSGGNLDIASGRVEVYIRYI